MILQNRRLLRVWTLCGLLVILITALATGVPVLADSQHATGRDTLHQSTGATATASKQGVVVYVGPGKGFWWVGTLRPNEVVPLLGISPDQQFFLVKSRKGDGWVFIKEVTIANADGLATVDPGLFGTITGGVANVRGGPGIGARSLATLPRGAQFFVLGQQPDGSWLKIRYRFGTGWVATSLTDLKGNIATTASSAEASGTPGTGQATPVGTPIPTTDGPIAIVNTGGLNVRSGPGSQFSSIGVLSGGDKVPIIGRTADGNWLLVVTDFGQGWVNINFVVTLNYFGNAPIITNTSSGAELAAFATVVTGTLNIRSGPNSAFDSIGTVNAGTRLPILGQSKDHGWWYVDSEFGKGWVSKLFTIASGAVSSVPVVTP